MKSFSLKIAVFSAVLGAGICPLHSQTAQFALTNPEEVIVEQKTIDLGLRNYETSLRLANSEAVLESVIFQSTKMKLTQPAQDYAGIIRELKRLSFKGSNPALRYKAYVAASVISNSDEVLDAGQIAHALSFTEETRNDFFAFLATALNDQQVD